MLAGTQCGEGGCLMGSGPIGCGEGVFAASSCPATCPSFGKWQIPKSSRFARFSRGGIKRKHESLSLGTTCSFFLLPEIRIASDRLSVRMREPR